MVHSLAELLTLLLFSSTQARGRTGEEPIWREIIAESAAIEQNRKIAIRRAILREPLWRTLLTGNILGSILSMAVRIAGTNAWRCVIYLVRGRLAGYRPRTHHLTFFCTYAVSAQGIQQGVQTAPTPLASCLQPKATSATERAIPAASEDDVVAGSASLRDILLPDAADWGDVRATALAKESMVQQDYHDSDEAHHHHRHHRHDHRQRSHRKDGISSRSPDRREEGPSSPRAADGSPRKERRRREPTHTAAASPGRKKSVLSSGGSGDDSDASPVGRREHRALPAAAGNLQQKDDFGVERTRRTEEKKAEKKKKEHRHNKSSSPLRASRGGGE